MRPLGSREGSRYVTDRTTVRRFTQPYVATGGKSIKLFVIPREYSPNFYECKWGFSEILLSEIVSESVSYEVGRVSENVGGI